MCMAQIMTDTLFRLTFTSLLSLIIPTHVHSQCWLDQAIKSGNVTFENALHNVPLKIGMYDEGLPWSDYDYDTNTFIGGYSVDIVKALSDTAGFIPNISLSVFKTGESYTSAAQRAVLTHDLAGPWFTDAAARRLLGMSFGHHFVDATLVLVIPIPSFAEKEFSTTAFLKPFTPGLWLILVCGIIFNAICSFLFYVLSNKSIRIKCKECFKNSETTKELLYSFGSYLYTSFGHFTATGDGFEPNTIYSRINTVMWSFLVVIVLASYTANLATALIAESAVSESLDTVEAIMSANKKICTVINSIDGERIKNRWPNIRLVDAYLNSGPFLRNGSCAGALLGASDVSVLLADNCDMQLTVERMFPSGGSFVFNSDESRCGPTIQQLLDYHFVRLEEEGILDELWANQVNAVQCAFNAPDFDINEEDIQLGSYDLGGLALIYAIGAVLLLGLNTIVVFFYEKKNSKNSNDNKEAYQSTKEVDIETELTVQVENNQEIAIQTVDP